MEFLIPTDSCKFSQLMRNKSESEQSRRAASNPIINREGTIRCLALPLAMTTLGFVLFFALERTDVEGGGGYGKLPFLFGSHELNQPSKMKIVSNQSLDAANKDKDKKKLSSPTVKAGLQVPMLIDFDLKKVAAVRVLLSTVSWRTLFGSSCPLFVYLFGGAFVHSFVGVLEWGSSLSPRESYCRDLFLGLLVVFAGYGPFCPCSHFSLFVAAALLWWAVLVSLLLRFCFCRCLWSIGEFAHVLVRMDLFAPVFSLVLCCYCPPVRLLLLFGFDAAVVWLPCCCGWLFWAAWFCLVLLLVAAALVLGVVSLVAYCVPISREPMVRSDAEDIELFAWSRKRLICKGFQMNVIDAEIAVGPFEKKLLVARFPETKPFAE
ncbi:hypothetical protein LXL04_034028 [Taraxacum kok-saghyz]